MRNAKGIWKIRPLAKFWASLLGYFWADCPLCGQYFAGFEWRHELAGSDIPDPKGRPAYQGPGYIVGRSGTAVCPDCVGRPETKWDRYDGLHPTPTSEDLKEVKP